MVVPSTLHQCIKYYNDQGEVHTLVEERQSFKGVEIYLKDAILYEGILEAFASSTEDARENYNSGNEEIPN